MRGDDGIGWGWVNGCVGFEWVAVVDGGGGARCEWD